MIRFYKYYSLLTFKILRSLIFILFLSFYLFTFFDFILGLLSLFLIWEIFFQFKIARPEPRLKLADNSENPLESFTIKSRSLLLGNSVEKIVKGLLKNPSVKFLMGKAEIISMDLTLPQIKRDDLILTSFQLAKERGGVYVTVFDIFAGFLLLSDSTTKILFNKKLKKENLIHILRWTNVRFPNEENPAPLRINFWGEGLGESWVYGWTLETKKYMIDFTANVVRRKPDYFGRVKEYSQIVEGLSAGQSVLLVGEEGVGKTSLIETLSIESFSGKLKGTIYHRRIYQFMTDNFLAGAATQGELEERFVLLTDEIRHSGNIIVLIQNLESILGEGSSKLDLSGQLLPYLDPSNKSLLLVATATPSSFKKFIEPRSTFAASFKIIRIEEPGPSETLEILIKKGFDLEERYNLIISYKALLSALDFGKKYIPERASPGASVLLLENATNKAKLSKKSLVTEEDVVSEVKTKTNLPVGLPKGEEQKILINLENEMHKHLVDQEDAVLSIAEGMRRVRAGLESSKKPISFLFLGPTGVGKTETAKTLANLYFGGEAKIIRLDMSEYSGSDGVNKILSPDKGSLADEIFYHPFSLILLDEFEKADSSVHNVFLQILDDGRMTDNAGRTVSFVDSIVIATSNAGSEFIRESLLQNPILPKDFKKSLLDYVQKERIFSPELLNRFDELVVFKPLSGQDLRKIASLMLSDVSQSMREKDIEVVFDALTVDKVAVDGASEEFGARPLKRFIQDNIEDILAKKILSGEIKRGDRLVVSSVNGAISVNKM
ncbi:MAG: ATPase with chaperone activity, ATP-binding subunit [Candidatus Levybacteria bacterium GW2011_GWA2_40_8]|nr:MAG: ATPase with chaperone activity, ATP-binding subunit [Candidatus Levybacteria bacterium GW2011_GWA2_40_8]